MLKLYNTLTRKIEEFKPINPPRVGMYTCGPTVYDYLHIGNWRTYVFADILRRVLEYNDFAVVQVENATDVGHLTGDNMGNADVGKDRMEEAAKREGKNIWEVAQFYIDDFLKSRNELNIFPPAYFVRATDHIIDQIDLIKRLEEKGLTYVTQKGVYFNTSKFPPYGKLGGQKLVDKRARSREELVEDVEKRNPVDFALWKLSKPEDKRQMEWDSPWGRGFPGWHIECSAMSMKYLGESFDIHTGGVDHIAIHHTNEIAQSEGATGKSFVNYWLHGEFLTVDGGRMGKSLGNAYTLHDVAARGFEPLVLRYLYLNTHYRTIMNFTWKSISASRQALNKLRAKVTELTKNQGSVIPAKAGIHKNNLYRFPIRSEMTRYNKMFLEAINNDLNMPVALAVVWEMTEDQKLKAPEKLFLLEKFDEVLGLRLLEIREQEEIPKVILELAKEREKYRQKKNWQESDQLRQQIEKKGYLIEDTSEGFKIKRKQRPF